MNENQALVNFGVLKVRINYVYNEDPEAYTIVITTLGADDNVIQSEMMSNGGPK